MATNDSDFERVSFLCIWNPEKPEAPEEQENNDKARLSTG